MLYNDFQETRSAAQRAAEETGRSVTLKRQGDGWVVEGTGSPKQPESPSPTGEIPWDSGPVVDPDDPIPF